MVPGEWRSHPDQDMDVGRHVPPCSPRVAQFMQYFEKRFRFEQMGRAGQIMAIASAHHRFNHIHPFLDGNGRVSRLMSHTMAGAAAIGARGLWSVSRGLARGLESRTDYKRMMDYADMPRQGDLDGRGNLSIHLRERCRCASRRTPSRIFSRAFTRKPDGHRPPPAAP
jgi:Fic family protein